MLKQRVVTAVILALFFLGALFFLPGWVFVVLIGSVLAVAAWEWANLSALKSSVSKFSYVVVVVLLSLACGYFSDWARSPEVLKVLLLIACAWWAVALLWVQGYPSSAVIWGAVPVRLLMGILVLIPAWLGFSFLRQTDSGAWLVLFVVLLVSAADIGAYFTGRAIGKRKLAPNVSPGKSWEGVIGGVVLAALLALSFNAFFQIGSWYSLIFVAIPTAFVSVLGDLVESMMKRHCGVKDSGRILPGHGGVLDRVDGLVAAIPVCTLVFISGQWQL